MQSLHKTYLFTDIETVPTVPAFADLGATGQKLFEKKFKSEFQKHSSLGPEIANDQIWEMVYQDNAALCAEFCKIVSIGFGYLHQANPKEDFELRIKTIVGKDEANILKEASAIMDNGNFQKIAGHNFENFDGPVMCRRMTINGIRIPKLLDPTGKSSWQTNWVDTMKVYAFGEWNAKCSLDRLCWALGVPSPKDVMDGSQVKDLFYGAVPGPEDLPFGKYDKEEVRFDAISKYQAGDIVALVNVFMRLSGENLIPEAQIKYV